MKKNKKKIVALVSSTALTLSSFTALSAACNSKPFFVSKLQNSQNEIYQKNKEELQKAIADAKKYIADHKKLINVSDAKNINDNIKRGEEALNNPKLLGGDLNVLKSLIEGSLKVIQLKISFIEDTSENRNKLKEEIDKLQQFIDNDLKNENTLKATATAILNNATKKYNDDNSRNVILVQQISFIENNINDWKNVLSSKQERETLIKDFETLIKEAQNSIDQYKNKADASQFNALAATLNRNIISATNILKNKDLSSTENIRTSSNTLRVSKENFENEAKNLQNQINSIAGKLKSNLDIAKNWINNKLGNDVSVQSIRAALQVDIDAGDKALKDNNSTLATLKASNSSLEKSFNTYQSLAENVKHKNRTSLVENLTTLIESTNELKNTIPANNSDYSQILTDLTSALNSAQQVNSNTKSTADALNQATIDLQTASNQASASKIKVDSKINLAKNNLNNQINIAKILKQQLVPGTHDTLISELDNLINQAQSSYASQDSSVSELDSFKDSLATKNDAAQKAYDDYLVAQANDARTALGNKLNDFKADIIDVIDLNNNKELTPFVTIAQNVYNNEKLVFDQNTNGTTTNEYLFLKAKSILDNFIAKTDNGGEYVTYKALLATLQSNIIALVNAYNFYYGDYQSTIVNKSNFYSNANLNNQYFENINATKEIIDTYAAIISTSYYYKYIDAGYDDSHITIQAISDANSAITTQIQNMSDFYNKSILPYQKSANDTEAQFNRLQSLVDTIRNIANSDWVKDYSNLAVFNNNGVQTQYSTYIISELDTNYKPILENNRKEEYAEKLDELNKWWFGDGTASQKGVANKLNDLFNGYVNDLTIWKNQLNSNYKYIDKYNNKKVKRWTSDYASQQMTNDSWSYGQEFEDAVDSYDSANNFLDNMIWALSNHSYSSDYNVKIDNDFYKTHVSNVISKINVFKNKLDNYIAEYKFDVYKARYAALALWIATNEIDLNGPTDDFSTNSRSASAYNFLTNIVFDMFPNNGLDDLLSKYNLNDKRFTYQYAQRYFSMIQGNKEAYWEPSYTPDSILDSTGSRDASNKFYNPYAYSSVIKDYKSFFIAKGFNVSRAYYSRADIDDLYKNLNQGYYFDKHQQHPAYRKWSYNAPKDSWSMYIYTKDEYRLKWYDWDNNIKLVENITEA